MSMGKDKEFEILKNMDILSVKSLEEITKNFDAIYDYEPLLVISKELFDQIAHAYGYDTQHH